MEGESGCHTSGPSPRQRVAVGGLGGAQRLGAELAVLEHLGVTQRDRGARRAVTRELDPADEVLAEVDDRATGR